MKITTIGIDWAKTTLSVHGVDAHGKALLRKTLSRARLLGYMSDLEPYVVGMEARWRLWPAFRDWAPDPRTKAAPRTAAPSRATRKQGPDP